MGHVTLETCWLPLASVVTVSLAGSSLRSGANGPDPARGIWGARPTARERRYLRGSIGARPGRVSMPWLGETVGIKA